MSDLTYKHTARVKADSWFMRFYLWLWEADIDNVDFCRLFWGYVFSIPNLLVRVIGYLPMKLGLAIADSTAGRRESWKLTPEEDRRIREAARVRKAVRKRKYEAFFARISAGADHFVAGWKAAWVYLKYPIAAVGAVLAVAVVCLVGVGLYDLALLVAAHLTSIGHTLLIALIVFGVFAVVLGVVLGLAWFFIDTKYGKSVWTGTKGGFLTFGGAMRTGAHGIKSRTCPKIEVVE